MREIKFRAFDKENKEMLYVSTLFLEGQFGGEGFGVSNTPYRNIDPETIMQYTGFKDKNGVEIFEGDIVKVFDWDSEEYLHTQVVKWSNVGGYFSEYDTGEFCPPIGDTDALIVKVIGNIYENPELLEK